MKYYVSKTHIGLDASGRLSGYETVLTRPAPLKATLEALRRYTAIGITSIHLCEHPKNGRRYGPSPMSLRISQSLRKRVTSRDIIYIDFCSRFLYTCEVTGRFTLWLVLPMAPVSTR